jgi:uncharacterized protein YjiS (DUF1127 family)
MSFDGEESRTHLPPEKGEPVRRARSWAPIAGENDMLRIALPHIALGASSPGFAGWRGALQEWRRRDRDRTELARLSEAELHDVGVTSAERWAEINKPFWRG